MNPSPSPSQGPQLSEVTHGRKGQAVPSRTVPPPTALGTQWCPTRERAVVTAGDLPTSPPISTGPWVWSAEPELSAALLPLTPGCLSPLGQTHAPTRAFGSPALWASVLCLPRVGQLPVQGIAGPGCLRSPVRPYPVAIPANYRFQAVPMPPTRGLRLREVPEQAAEIQTGGLDGHHVRCECRRPDHPASSQDGWLEDAPGCPV